MKPLELSVATKTEGMYARCTFVFVKEGVAALARREKGLQQ